MPSLDHKNHIYVEIELACNLLVKLIEILNIDIESIAKFATMRPPYLMKMKERCHECSLFSLMLTDVDAT